MLDMGFAEQVEEILASSYKKGKVKSVCVVFRKKLEMLEKNRIKIPADFAWVTWWIKQKMCFFCVCSSTDSDSNPQTLLFSATCPSWVYEVAKKYMRPGCKHVDLIGKKTQKAATTVEVSVCVGEQNER